MKMNQPFETAEHDLSGKAALDFYGKDDFNSFAVKLIDGYNPDRFDAVALRFFIQKGSPVITLFALDKLKQEQENYPHDKLPVKKIKLENVSLLKMFDWFEEFNFTINTGNYNIEDMEVINK